MTERDWRAETRSAPTCPASPLIASYLSYLALSPARPSPVTSLAVLISRYLCPTAEWWGQAAGVHKHVHTQRMCLETAKMTKRQKYLQRRRSQRVTSPSLSFSSVQNFKKYLTGVIFNKIPPNLEMNN